MNLRMSQKDAYLLQHNKNVCRYSIALVKELNLPNKYQEVVCQAAFYHDIGKINIPDSILFKPGKLSEVEWQIMKLHPKIGSELVSNKDIEVVKAIRHHHERWDGKGYPDGLKGENIPLAARIVAVADAFDAMTTYRLYREAITTSKAMDELCKCAGSQFDLYIVEKFLESRHWNRINTNFS